MTNNLKKVGTQPLPHNLKQKLPVSYYLFSLVNNYANESPAVSNIAQSTFHKTKHYYVIPFYKAISNIL
jgi:hypothetical protein